MENTYLRWNWSLWVRELWDLQYYPGRRGRANFDEFRTAEAALSHFDWLTNEKLDPYCAPTFKDELSPADGIVFKGQQAVIPKSMRPAMPDKTRFGAGLCIRRANASLFWRVMTSDIKNKCMSCSVCAQCVGQAPK